MRGNSTHRIDIAILAVAVAGYLLFFKLTNMTWVDIFWDFDVYQRAVTDAVLGLDPYRLDAGFPFLYHPVVLYAFMLLDRFIGFANGFIGLSTAAVLIFLWGYTSVRGSGCRALPAEYLSFGDKAIVLVAVLSTLGSFTALMAANITLFLHLALIGSTLAYLQQRSALRRLLMLTIFSCTLLVKPYFLVFALPLLLIERFSFRAIAWMTAALLASAAIYLVFWVFFNEHTMLFIKALDFKMSSTKDLPYSSLGVLLLFLPMDLALKVHIAIAAMIALFVLFLRRFSAVLAGGRDDDGMLFLLAYVLMTLCSPRMKEYDLMPAFICLYLYLSFHGLSGRLIILLSLLIMQLPLWVMLYLGRMNTPEIFSSSFYLWDMAGFVLPLAIFLGWKVYCAASSKGTPVAAS